MNVRSLHRTATWILASCAILACGFALYAALRIPVPWGYERILTWILAGHLAFTAYSMVAEALGEDDEVPEPASPMTKQLGFVRAGLLFMGGAALSLIMYFTGGFAILSLLFSMLFALGGSTYLLAAWRQKLGPHTAGQSR